MKKSYTLKLKKFGERVKKLREESNFTQETLSDLCEVDIRTIQRIEKGEFGTGLPLIFALADAFKINVAELFKF